MKIFKRILDDIVKVVSVLLICLVMGIVLLMLNELFLRNILDKSFRGMTELAGFMFLWMSFLGIVVLFDQNRLISLDMFSSRMKGALKTGIWYIQKIVSLVLGIIMVVAFIGLYPYISTEFYSSMPHFSKLWQYVPLAISGGFMAAKSIFSILEKSLLLSQDRKQEEKAI